MTQKELIKACNSIGGACCDCPVSVEMLCDVYQEKYGTTPYMDEKVHPERSSADEIRL